MRGSVQHASNPESPPHGPVVLAAIDAARPAALTPDVAPRILGLKALGAYTLNARSVMPSVTLPCFLSIFHSIPPDRHGTPYNTWIPMARPVPGLVEVARAAGLRCGFVYNWEALRSLSTPLQLHFSYFLDNLRDGPWADRAMVDVALEYLQHDRPDFVFVYLGSLDVCGHDYGFHSDEYLAQLRRIDSMIGVLLDGLPQATRLMLTSDHGGHARTHGTDSPDDMAIPLFLSGPGIRVGHEIETPVTLLDLAPTLARLLGVAPAPEWEGTCISEAFA